MRKKSAIYKSRNGIPFFTPREWLVRAMQKWAKESLIVSRKKDIEIKALKERIRELEYETGSRRKQDF